MCRRNSEAPSLHRSPFSVCLERSFWHLRGMLPCLFWVLSKVHQWPTLTRVPECSLCVLTGLKLSNWHALSNDGLSSRPRHPNTEKLPFTLQLKMGPIDNSCWTIWCVKCLEIEIWPWQRNDAVSCWNIWMLIQCLTVRAKEWLISCNLPPQ